MSKLYPPYIEGSIPAFYGEQLIVPYEMNKTVGYKDISGFKLKIITVSTNRTIEIIDDNGYNIETKEAYFNMPLQKMVMGQFYKIQLAYKNLNNEVGFYSTIGVVKYCAEPFASIEGLQSGNINLHQYDYVGYYEPSNLDPTEVELYYQFDVYDYNNNLYASSGKKIHNATIEGGDLYQLADSFEEQKVYSIKYTVWTLNNLKISSHKYRLMERQSLDIEIDAELKADLNYDEGYVNVSLLSKGEAGQVAEGAFLITRADSLSDYKQWNELYRFELRNEKLKSFSFKDFTIQQGVEYQYSIQQYNDNGLYSNRLLSDIVKADFEDSFLYDGKRQLKIRFNPKISSFKNSVLEQKVNTIGSKYPFIFRNGNVSYKEFPLGGLISYLSDPENLFIKNYKEELHRHSTKVNDNDILDYFSTDLVSDNLTKERLFKLEALEWLTNGEPKLFRSPTEGNYIVRLLNTNMQPQDALGRMLHSFTATAYEVAELNYNNLVFYGFINSDGIDKTQMKWETVELAIANNGTIEYRHGQINRYPAVMIEFTGMMPGSRVILDGQEIQIGINGSYYTSLDSPVKVISIPENENCIGFMTYAFYGESVSKFNKIHNIELNEVLGWQVENDGSDWLDILDAIEDEKTELVNFYYLKFRKSDHLTPKTNDVQNNIYPILNNDSQNENNEYLIKINNEFISIKEIETYTIENFNRPEYLLIGSDVICEACYQTKVIDYNIENNNKELNDLKNNWLIAQNNYLKLLEDYPIEMKKLEDQLIYHLTMKKVNERVEELTEEEKTQLENEIEELKENPYYKLLTFEEAQDYTNINIPSINAENKEDFNIPRDPWNEIYNQILIEVELANRENNKELEEYWIARRDELYSIMSKYLPEDHKYIYSKGGFYEDKYQIPELTTLLHNQDGTYSYQPGENLYLDNQEDMEKFYNEEYDYNNDKKLDRYDLGLLQTIINGNEENKIEGKTYDINLDGEINEEDLKELENLINKKNTSIIAHPGIEVNIAEKGWVEKGESYSLEQAYYLPTEEFNYNPRGDIISGSLWIDTKNQEPIIIYPNKYYEVIDSDKDCVRIGVDTYIGSSDPYSMEIYVDLWIDNSDITSSFEDSLQKKVDMFYYNGESYKDIAYLNPVTYLAAQELFNKQYEKDKTNIKQKINTAEYEMNKAQEQVNSAEKNVHDKKIEIAVFEQKTKELEKAVEDAKYAYEKIEDSASNKTEAKKVWDDAQAALDAHLASSDYLDNINGLKEKLAELQNVLNEANKVLFQKQSDLSIAEENLKWLKGSKDFLFNMSEEFYTNNGINTGKDYHDGGWCSAVLRHRIYNNENYDKIYNDKENQILGKRNEIYIKAPFLKEQDELIIENYYYTDQELTLEERKNVEDVIMNAISEDQSVKSFTYKQKLELDEIWKEILNLKIEREEELKDISISIMDFTEPERYFLLFSRSHYIEDPDTKRPVLVEYEKDKDGNETENIKNIIAGKGYCMYQFYDRTTAEYRVKQLEINISEYIEKHGIKETEVNDWLIRNDINERDELLAYLKYLEDFYPTNALSAPGYNIFRPITLNEIINGKLHIEEELELAYKQYLENNDKTFKRLVLGYNVPNFYYKTGNYTRIKECQDRILELNKILEEIIVWRENEPEAEIQKLLKEIKDYGNSLNESREDINKKYNKYIDKLKMALEEEKSE